MNTIYTIGHSNHSTLSFLNLLKKHNITALADVRSHPASRFCPHFNKDFLKDSLLNTGIQYVFLGNELGARVKLPEVYENGKLSYSKLAQRKQFQEGLERIKKGAEKYSICLMCSEKNPIDCHRAILVARQLELTYEANIHHIHYSGEIETQTDLNNRLLGLLKLDFGIFNRELLISQAYEIQGNNISYSIK